MTLHTAHDLGAAVRERRPDASAAGIAITDDWCREQMHALGITRYEDVDGEILSHIADRVDTLAGEESSADITDEQIAALRAESAKAGDHAQVLICDLALGAVVLDEDTTIESMRISTFLSPADRRRISNMDPDDYRAACALTLAAAQEDQ